MKPALIVCALLASASSAQIPGADVARLPIDFSALREGAWPLDRVVYDEPADGRTWARGATWKASFGADGCTYFPALAKAPRNFPVRFRLAGVRVGGAALPLAESSSPVRDGDRITYEHGGVREIYDLSPSAIEQTFVVTTEVAGEVEVELAMESELQEDAARAGLQFSGPFGGVEYGAAFLVRDGAKLGIDTEHGGSAIRFRVPAAMRGAGPVVIDPVISTQAASTPSTRLSPDVAYDATHDRYLVVFETEFSEFDHDVFSVMFDAEGNPIAGSGAGIDISTIFHSHPRVADLNESDRFLVVTSVADPLFGGRQMIYGRMRDAGGSMALHPWVLLSDPTLPGGNYLPDVGADPSTDPGNHDWLVVWARSGTQVDIEGRLVQGNGQPRFPSVLPIHSDGLRNWDVDVSRSNSNGSVQHPQWFVTYTRSSVTNGSDVFLRGVSPDGVVNAEQPVDTSGFDDHFPQVSSPMDYGNGQTAYMVVYERPLAVVASFRRILGSGTTVTQQWDLQQRFSVGRYTPRVETDGIRFVVTASQVNPNSTLADFTHAYTFLYSFGLQLQDVATVPGVVTEPQIVSERNSGGLAGDYAIAHLQLVNGFRQAALTRYAGTTPGPMTQVLATGCNGLGIAVEGSTALGNELRFSLSGYGTDLPCLGFGGASIFPLPLCTGCSLGLRLDLPIFSFFGTSSATLAVPATTWLIGETFAMQGFSIGAGSCLGGLTFSDTIQFTVR